MQIVRTVVWIIVTAALVSFIAMNWERAPVNFWPLEDGYLHFDWPVGVIALFFFLLGLVPTWLVYRATRWNLNRRINALENSVRVTSLAPSTDASTQPETTETKDAADAEEGRPED